MFNRFKRRKKKVEVKPEVNKTELVKQTSSPRLFDNPQKDVEQHGCPNMNVNQTVIVNVNEPEDDCLDKCCGCFGGIGAAAATAAI